MVMIEKITIRCSKCGKIIPKFKKRRFILKNTMTKETIIKNYCDKCIRLVYEEIKTCL